MKATNVLKWIVKILIVLLVAALLIIGLASVPFVLAINSCEQSNARRNELTEGRVELNLDYYGSDVGKLELIDGGVYGIPGIDTKDIVCSTVYWFGQPNGEPMKILLAPDSAIKEPVFDLVGKRVTVRGADAPTEYAEIIKAAMKGDRHQGIEWTDQAPLCIYLGDNGSFYFHSSVYLYDAADGRGRVYFVQGTNGLYYELTDTEGLYDWLDTNVFVS